MQPLDKNTLFSIFEAGDEEIYKEAGVEDQLKNPFVLMGMVLRGLENFSIMDMMYLRRHPKDYKNVRAITKYKYYTKLYKYLERIDSNNFDKIYKIADSFGRDETFVGLENLLRYFEKIEQYERCAVIKRYQDLLIDSYVPHEFIGKYIK
jgi:hypothetical protein